MRLIDGEILLKAVKNLPHEAISVIMSGLCLTKCGDTSISKAEYIDLSENEIVDIGNLFRQFPSGWWFNLSKNMVKFI
jgi:hypothetical protein